LIKLFFFFEIKIFLFFQLENWEKFGMFFSSVHLTILSKFWDFFFKFFYQNIEKEPCVKYISIFLFLKTNYENIIEKHHIIYK